jgi:hypothetical protein
MVERGELERSSSPARDLPAVEAAGSLLLFVRGLGSLGSFLFVMLRHGREDAER